MTFTPSLKMTCDSFTEMNAFGPQMRPGDLGHAWGQMPALSVLARRDAAASSLCKASSRGRSPGAWPPAAVGLRPSGVLDSHHDTFHLMSARDLEPQHEVRGWILARLRVAKVTDTGRLYWPLSRSASELLTQ